MSDTHDDTADTSDVSDASAPNAPNAPKDLATEPGSATAAAGGVDPQDEPVLDQQPVSDDERIDGIVAQTQVDVGGESLERIAEVLRQRFTDSSMAVSDDQLKELAKRVSTP